MPDKLTDKEIVKALEIFVNSVGKGFVFANVDIKKDGVNEFKHIDLSFDETFDLINRLQAENDRKDKIYIELLKTSSERAEIIGQQNAEIERLKQTVEDKGGLILINKAKSEAYKEFADKVKQEIDNIRRNAPSRHIGVVIKYLLCLQQKINDFLKELVGE